MVLDVSADDVDDFGREYQEDSDEDRGQDLILPTPTFRDLKSAVVVPPITPRRQLRQLHIGALLEMILQDAQTRLFFKAQAMVQAEIKYYVPKGNDLDYPAKLTSEHHEAEHNPFICTDSIVLWVYSGNRALDSRGGNKGRSTLISYSISRERTDVVSHRPKDPLGSGAIT